MRQHVVVFVLGTAALLAAEPALAVPAFARRYEVACHFCHQGYPKLNALGQRFKERGFRMEKEDTFQASKWIATIPLSLRPSARRDFIEDRDGSTSAFIKGISAGSLGSRLSYWVDDGVLIREGDDNFTHTKPDNAWGRVEVVTGGKLYVRGGRLELDLPFTQTRTPHLFSYEIYFANTGFETDNIGDYQDGVEIGGSLPQDVRWSAAVVKGRNSETAESLSSDADKFDANLFLRASKRVDKHRLGAFAYIGRNTLARRFTDPGRRPPSVTAVWEDDLLRLGADGDLWVDRFNLYGVYMYGRNDNSVATAGQPSGTGESLSFSGGFLQGDYHLRAEVAITLRWNAVRLPAGPRGDNKETFSSLFPGVQVWLLERLKLSFEYGFRNKDRPNRGAVQAEVAF